MVGRCVHAVAVLSGVKYLVGSELDEGENYLF